MRAPEELSREELIALVGDHAARIAVQDKLIAELAAANEDSSRLRAGPAGASVVAQQHQLVDAAVQG